MASGSLQTGMTPESLNKLTVPQLKALCKERKITGYSKLGKPALIQKLAPGTNVSSSDATPQPGKSQSNPGCTPTKRHDITQIKVTTIKNKPESTESADNMSGEPHSTVERKFAGATARYALELSDPTQFRPSTIADRQESTSDNSTASTDLISGEPLQAPDDSRNGTTTAFAAKATSRGKRTKESIGPVTKRQKTQESACPTTRVLPADSVKRSIFKVPVIPKDHRVSLAANSSVDANRSAAPPAISVKDVNSIKPVFTSSSPAGTGTQSTGGKRFKKLVVSKRPCPPIVQDLVPRAGAAVFSDISTKATQDNTSSHQSTLYHLDFPHAELVPTLIPITLPPSLTQRKRVHRWAVVLSGLSNKERRQCVLVSRMFRYAVYLSASTTLVQYYSGRRLQDVMRQYPQAMTNMWPYLRLRRTEAETRRAAFEQSYLAGFLRRCGVMNPITDRLWASPDNDQQIIIALRFVLSRVWFKLSIGCGHKSEVASWLHDQVIEAQEVVKNELWRVTVSALRSATTASFYVVKATCEVVGRAPPDAQARISHTDTFTSTSNMPIRADWSAYIAHYQTSSGETPALLDLIKWAHYEEYERGISRLWLKRVATEGELGKAKQAVAERYVLACVVANGVSGEWKSTTEMAQDFASLPSRMAALNARRKVPSVNMYLPEHHHVESVHFTTSDGRFLHPGLAVVQTPHREYYVLRDNGMQVGYEEEGVADVWQEVLKCNEKGL